MSERVGRARVRLVLITREQITMQLVTPSPELGHAGLRALFTVAKLDGTIGPEERSVLEAARRFADPERSLESLETIEPEELAHAFAGEAHLAWQLTCALALMSMVDRDPSPEESALVDRYARALGVDNDMVGTLKKVTSQHLRLARTDIYRRFWAREHIVAKIEREGWSGLTETIRALRRKEENPELTARYRALGELPEGTLGRGYFEFIRDNHFSYPGELGHGPEIIAQHDLAHVLGGYGASSQEEIAVAFFSAGFRRKDPMTFVLLGLFQLHLGIGTMPGQPVDSGALDMRVCMEALQRGAAMNVDLSGPWDFWAVIDRPIAALREEYGIPPRREHG
jgi:hypothetical protein